MAAIIYDPAGKYHHPRCVFFSLVLTIVTVLFSASAILGASSRVTMQDGRVLTGEIAPIDSVASNPDSRRSKENNPVEKIVVIDDQLRLTYVPKNRILDIAPDDIGASAEIFKFRQPIFRSSTQSAISLGSYKTSEPFDEFGRRTLYFNGTPVVQGITEIAPGYVRVQGLNLGLDMRISPHSFQRDFLTSMIKKQIDPNDLPDRLRIYLFYTQAELFEEAAAEMEEIIHDFQNVPENMEQLNSGLKMIRQLSATRLVDELKLRRSAGQHNKVRNLIAAFSEEGVTSDLTLAVRKMAEEYNEEYAKRTRILDELHRMCETLSNDDQRKETQKILEEIEKELDSNTVNRFSEFLLSLADQGLDDEHRLAIGISGWIAGNSGTDNRLEIALSMVRLRDKIKKYLNETTLSGRTVIMDQIRAEEASASIETPVRIIRYMKPPKDAQQIESTESGYYEIEIPSFEDGKQFQYAVQLPPEYDPNRKYPTVVTLHSERTTPQTQIDWWAGPWKEKTDQNGNIIKERFGQGTRFGYIVIAPRWSDDGSSFQGTAAETGAVLYSLRDATRKFSIDTDRVFLTGHSSGGDAAWDIGLAHPDLWAGVIPIGGKANRYPYYLRKNAEFVPIYAVNGELDGGKTAISRGVLDPGMNQSHPFDLTCVVFRGRGNESFSDELIRIFEWMSSRSRDFFPKGKRTVYSMRPWDNSFWLAEFEAFPPKSVVLPFDWTAGKLPPKYSPAKTEFLKIAENSIKIVSTADHCRVYLAPEAVNFDQRIEVMFNGKRISPTNGIILPSIEVLLEDVRTRSDRLHPFQAFADSQSKK